LAKVTYFTLSADRRGGRLHFKKFETEKVDDWMDFMVCLFKNTQCPTQQVLKATGGGAHLFYDKLNARLPNVIVQKEDEMDCLINGTSSKKKKDGKTNISYIGLNFFITEIPYEVFTYNEMDSNPIRFEEKSKNVYPYMVKFYFFFFRIT
jgi:type II pantothenate kinase